MTSRFSFAAWFIAVSCLPALGGEIVITFDVEDDLVTPLVNGQQVGTPPEFGNLFNLTWTDGGTLGPTIFDSSNPGPNQASADQDLLVNSGPILIFQDSAFSTQTVSGIFDVPNDSAVGGVFKFDFSPTTYAPRLTGLTVVDLDDGNMIIMTLTDTNDNQRIITVPPQFTGDINEGDIGIGSIDLTSAVSEASPNVNAPAGTETTVTTDPGFDIDSIATFDVELTGSGAIDNLAFVLMGACCDESTFTCTEGVPEEDCMGPNETWYEDVLCDDPIVDCAECDGDEDCSDDNVCNGIETCVDGSCVNGTPLSCEAIDACHTAICDPQAGCLNDVLDCDDEDPCTEDECDPVAGCQNPPMDCNDDNVCTNDFCDDEDGCIHPPISCDPIDACHSASCDPIDGCQQTELPCDPIDACHSASCDPVDGCIQTELPCDPIDACHSASCDPIDGCQQTELPCDPIDACHSAACDPVNGCEQTELPCDPIDACHSAACDPVDGCVQTELPCDPDNVCDIASCDPVDGCQHTPVDCDDGDVCTDDSCDRNQGCVHTPNDVCGACCLPIGSCVGSVLGDECDASDGTFFPGQGCDEVTCENIPTVSQWGLIIMTLLGCTLGTLIFRGRPNTVDDRL